MAAITSEETQGEFTRVIKVINPTNDAKQQHFIALLDSGCFAGDMITSEVVSSLGYTSKIQSCDKAIGICIDGHEIRSAGVVNIQWHVVGGYHIVESWFQVVEGESLPWQIVLGAETCIKYHLLTVGVFGKVQVPHKKSKRDKERDTKRLAKHDQEVAENAKRVKADKAANDSAAANYGQPENRDGYGASNSETHESSSNEQGR